MTNHYLRNAVPDHIAGVISACEGIQNNLVLLNGPIGCKTYYTFSGVDSLIRRSNLWTLGDELRLEDAMDDRLLRSQFCIGSPRIPATNLRYSDYIFGTAEQLHRALNDLFSERSYDLFTVIRLPVLLSSAKHWSRNWMPSAKNLEFHTFLSNPLAYQKIL